MWANDPEVPTLHTTMTDFGRAWWDPPRKLLQGFLGHVPHGNLISCPSLTGRSAWPHSNFISTFSLLFLRKKRFVNVLCTS